MNSYRLYGSVRRHCGVARYTSDLYRIVSLPAENGVAFRVVDDLSIDTTFRTGAWGQYASNFLAPNRTGVTGIEVGPLIAVPEIK